MQIVMKKTSELIPYARNNKIHNERQVKLVAASIQEFGFKNPVIVDKENWVFCKENNDYIVMENGLVFSVCHRQKSKAGNEVVKYRLNLLKGSIDKYGYRTVRMSVEGEKKHMKIHRLVMCNFKENIDNLPTVNHIDGNKENNALNNLEFSDYSHQMKHSFETGLRSFTENQREAVKINIKKAQASNIGRTPHNKLPKEKEKAILKECEKGGSISLVAKKFSVNWSTVKRIISRNEVIIWQRLNIKNGYCLRTC